VEHGITPYTVYTVGVSLAVFGALLWSFVLDKKKPPTVKEFIAKLIARALFLIVLFAVLMGFLYLAFGVFR
jgi:membrane associated rhomboid family serine protease